MGGGSVYDEYESLENRRWWKRRRSQNPSHGIGTAGEHRRPGSADPAGLEDGEVGDQVVSVLRGGQRRRNRRTLVATRVVA